MPLSVGEAVLSFLADTTNLDAALAQVTDGANKSMTAAAGSVDVFTGKLADIEPFALKSMTGASTSVDKFTGSLKGIEPVFDSLHKDVDDWNEEVMRVMGEAGQGVKVYSSKVALASEKVKELTGSMAVGQQGAVKLGEVTSLAGTKMRESMYQARGETQLLGEAFGIHLPRHVRTFIAELPGMGSALSAAFEATAVFFLIEALVQGAEKLSNFIASMFIYTQAAKDAAAAQIVLNQKFLETADAIKKAKDALEDYGLTASQKTTKAIEGHTKSLVDNTKEIEANKLKMAQLAKEQADSAAAAEKNAMLVNSMAPDMAVYTDAVKDNSQAIQDLKNKNALLMRGMEELRIEMQVLALQLRDEEDAARKATLAKQEEFSQAQINGARTVGSAVLNLQKAQAEAAVTFDGTSATQRLLIDQQFAEKQYQLELSTAQKTLATIQQTENRTYAIEKANLENRLSVQKTMGAAGIEAVKATQVQIEELTKSHGLKLATEEAKSNSQIEALHKNHQAKLLDDANKLIVDFDVMNAAIQQSALAKGFFPNLPEDTRNVLSMADAAARLGFVLSGDLKKSAAAAADALKVLDMEYKGGLISLRDLQQAQMAALRVQIEYDKEIGESPKVVKAEQDALDKLTKSFDDAYGKKATTLFDLFSTDFKKKAKDTGTVAEQEAQMVATAAMQMQKAFESAMVSAILSQSSFGAALQKATAEVLASLAVQAEVKALFYLAEAFAALAAHDAEAAAGFFKAAGEMALVGAVAGVAAAAINPSSGSGSSGNPNQNAGNNAQQTSSSGGGSNQTVSVTHLAEGGLVTGPTRAIIGEKGAEAVIPLTDPDVMARLANALLSPSTLRIASARLSDPSAIAASGSGAARAGFDEASMTKFAEHVAAHLESSGTGGGDTHIHNHIKGLLDSGTLVKTMGKMSKMVQQNRATLHSSNSFRVTRRSQ